MVSAFILLMLAAGAGIALQVTWNARLRSGLESPALSSMVSLVISLITMLPIWASGVLGHGKFTQQAASIPAWAWCGGILGAFYLTASLVSVPRLGAALVVGSAVTGQLITALVLDSFGLFDLPKVPLSWYRVLGALFLLTGLVLLQKK